ncbi:hypothetical protein [Leptolyngbya sp. FACHB-711]|uniref:hypothetical protein n=1 Tax=unclassified Leptolyngbya TaxID=2650499 RepID=UPI00168896E3|nr:hypothetical protein [Leptolyngbya sp. FACHB-711]MBD1848797.1 hypothetical protein [Cyanobacteria bacterium FACHB-502]MBD2027142.1 hypothetical protein [Leptolyngbya sp. FACHB-711]
MAENPTDQGKEIIENFDPAESAGAKAAQIAADPTVSLEEAKAAAAGEADNGAGSVAPSTVAENTVSRSDPEASDIPSSDNH